MKMYIPIASIIILANSCGNGGGTGGEKQAENATKNTTDTTMGAKAMQAKNDSAFLAFASNVGTFEIQAAKLADEKSKNKGVKDFAALMIKDHTELGNKVTALAAQKGITLPTALNTDLQNEYNKLDSLNGKKFEEEYIDANVKGHTEAISKFEGVANGNDYSPDVKQFASAALPTLREHKEHAEALQQTENGNKKKTS